MIEENEIPKLKHCIIGKDDIHDGLDFYNKVINADLFEVLGFLPNEFADLIIVEGESRQQDCLTDETV